MKDVRLKVLDEIMNLMDQKSGERLKGHPKLMAAKVVIAKPLDKKAMSMDEMPMDMEDGEGPGHEMGEGPEHEIGESPVTESLEDLIEGLDEDKKAKILKLLK